MAHPILKESADGVLAFDPDLELYIKYRSNEKTIDCLKVVKNPQNVRDFRGASLLHIAAEYDNAEMTKSLIDSNFDINLQDKHKRTALMIAIKHRHFATAQVLLESNADFYVCDTFGISILRFAIMMDTLMSPMNGAPHPAQISQLTDKYWQIIEIMLNRFNKDLLSNSENVAKQLLQMNCPLSHVVFMRNSEVIRIMIKKGSPIDATDCFKGQTALHWAVEHQKSKKVKILLENGADVNALNYYNKTPLMCIYNQFHYKQMMPPCDKEIVKALLERKPTFSTSNDGLNLADQLYDIFRYGSKEALRLAMIERNDLFFVRNKKQETLLHALARNSYPGIGDIMKGRQIDVDARNDDGETALYCALKYAKDRDVDCTIAEYLLSAGACPNSKNRVNREALNLLLIHNDRDEYRIQRLLQYIYLMIAYGAHVEEIIVDVARNDPNISLAKPALALLAIREVLNVYISQNIRWEIESQYQLYTYFNLCVNQLKEAESSILFKSVTVFQFLTASNKKISLYARDKNLVKNLPKLIKSLKLDPYYMYILRKHCTEMSQIVKARVEAEDIINQNIGKFYGYNSIVTRLIIEFLDDDDVKKLFSVEF